MSEQGAEPIKLSPVGTGRLDLHAFDRSPQRLGAKAFSFWLSGLFHLRSGSPISITPAGRRA